MSESRRRRPSWLALSLLFLLLLPATWSCEMPSTGGSTGTASTSSTSEAERTRKI